MIHTTVCACVPVPLAPTRKMMWPTSFTPTVTGSLLLISGIFAITPTVISPKSLTETVTAIPEFWKSCEHTMTAAIPAMYGRITADICGEKNPTAGRDTVCMTGHSVSCTSGDAGICWNVWNRIPVSYAPFLLMQNKHVFYDHHSSHLFLV